MAVNRKVFKTITEIFNKKITDKNLSDKEKRRILKEEYDKIINKTKNETNNNNKS